MSREQQNMQCRLSDLGEIELISRLRALVPESPGVRTGIGDDGAVVSGSGDQETVLTSDAVIEGTHFTRADPPSEVGHKAVARVLSDLAAMGAEPEWCLVNLVAPGNLAVSYVEALYRGMAATASRSGLGIVGGDCSRSEPLSLHCFATGTVAAGTAMLRSGARDSDAVFVTGELGGSGMGRHLRFDPRIPEGRWLREWGQVTAMIDVSDGLATDAAHLAQASTVGIVIRTAELPVSDDARRMAGDHTATQHALCDGEDFELLFTVGADAANDLPDAWSNAFATRLTRIGVCDGDPGALTLEREDGIVESLGSGGFDHFK
jgi:thiamine-monophosphate kinase